MSYNAIDLARYIISKCSKEQCPISNLQLQKILYYIQVEWLSKNNEPLFNNDICAWQFPSRYQRPREEASPTNFRLNKAWTNT